MKTFLITTLFLSFELARAQLQLIDVELLVCAQRSLRGCSQQSVPPLLERSIESCKMTIESEACRAFVQENPSARSMLRRCDLEGFCRDAMSATPMRVKGCASAYWEATEEIIDFFSNAWSSGKKSIEAKNDFIKKCNESINCKRNLVKDIAKYQTMSDEVLNKFTAAFLDVEAQNHLYISSTARRHSARPMTREERDKRMDEEESYRARRQTPATQYESGLFALAEDWLDKKFVKYRCLNAEGRAEMMCYAAAMILDPTLAAGMAFKAPRAARYLSQFLKGSQAERRLGSSVSHSVSATRAELKARLLHAEYTTVTQNQKWIEIATRESPNGKVRFVEVENSKLKELNDNLKDKDLVTAMTNMHKQLVFEEVEKLKKKNPGLLFSPYSDFKSVRLAIEGPFSDQHLVELQAAVDQANKKFAAWVKLNKLVRAEDNPASWFKMGSGQTADQASSAARFSRETQGMAHDFSDPRVLSSLNQKIAETEGLRTQLAQDLSETRLLQKTPQGHQVLAPDAFEILRKESDLVSAQQRLKDRFGLDTLSPEVTQRMMIYSKKVDQFSPSLMIAQKEVASLDQAHQGGFSIDFIGLGAQNLRATAAALAGQNDVQKALRATRQSERELTQVFQKQKETAREVSVSTAGQGQIESLCSGDDCVGLARAPLSNNDKNRIVQNLARELDGTPVRVAFISPGIRDTSVRTQIATHGEALEKILRRQLESRLEPTKLRGLVFAIDMQTTQLGEGAARVLIGESSALKLSKSDQLQIQKAFQQAVSTLNKEVRQATGRSGYRADLGK